MAKDRNQFVDIMRGIAMLLWQMLSATPSGSQFLRKARFPTRMSICRTL